MPALARNHITDSFTRAANDDCINGGLCTRTKYSYVENRPLTMTDPTGLSGGGHIFCNGDVCPYLGTQGWGTFGPAAQGVGGLNWGAIGAGAGSGSYGETPDMTLTWYNPDGTPVQYQGTDNNSGAGAASTNTSQSRAPTVDLTPPPMSVPDPDNPGGYVEQLTSCANCNVPIETSPLADVSVPQESADNPWVGIGLDAAEHASGTSAIGTNFRLYSAPRGNQYFRTLVGVGNLFKAAGVVALAYDTVVDFTDPDVSSAQAYGDLGIGLTGLAIPFYIVPGSVYGVASYYYPGGRPAYNAAFSETLNATEGGGPQ